MVRKKSKSEKRAEVEAWRASGISLVRFASERGYSRSALEKWAQAVREEDKALSAPRFVRLAAASMPSALVVEIGAARVRVEQGFDPGLLREVISALEGKAS
jgi:transposase-like protein